MRKIIIPSLIIISIIVNCAVNPVTGKREFMLISESQEIAMGREYDPQITQMYGVYNDDKLSKYVNDLGQEMAAISHRPNLNYEIKVMDSPVINAFAVPGGYVYITRGILAYLNSEAELAGVMGHEIGHVTARHSAKQQSKAQLAQLGLGLGSMLFEGFSTYAGIAGQAVGLLFLKFGRDDERQSDMLGVEYSTKVGYNSSEMASFFAVLDKMHSTGTNSLPDFLSTHPNPGERVVDVRKLTQKEQNKYPGKNFIINRDAFLKNIDGLIFGADPEQGFVEGNIFYHPGLKFQFPTPDGWTVNNLPSQVQMYPEDQKAVLVFKLEQSKDQVQAAANFLTDNKLTRISQQSLKINGAETEEVIASVTTENGVIYIMAHFIKLNENVYSLIGSTIQADFETYKPTFNLTMGGFKSLTDNSKLNRKPDRISVKKVNSGSSLRNVLISFGVKEDDLDSHALLNGAADLNDTIATGTYIKIITKGN